MKARALIVYFCVGTHKSTRAKLKRAKQTLFLIIGRVAIFIGSSAMWEFM